MAHQETLRSLYRERSFSNDVQLFKGSNKTNTICFEMYIAGVALELLLELSCLTLAYERTSFTGYERTAFTAFTCGVTVICFPHVKQKSGGIMLSEEKPKTFKDKMISKRYSSSRSMPRFVAL